MKETGKYSFGIGDRFSHQGKAQLQALMKASARPGIYITPVWNKSNREHNIVHSEPSDTRAEADAAVIASCVTENIYERHVIPLFRE